MKKNCFIYPVLVFCFLLPNAALAQIEIKVITDNVFEKLSLNESITPIKNYSTYQEIDGSPYIFENFTKGTIKLKKSDPIQGDFRYDKYADEVHFKKDEKFYAIAFPKEVEYIQIDSLKFIYSDFWFCV